MNFSLQEAVPVLERTPRILEVWLSGLPESWLRASEGPGTYSPLDVLRHLIHGEETDWIPRATLILEYGESRAFEPFDRAGGDLLAGLPPAEALARFQNLRVKNLAWLRGRNLTGDHLELLGRHPDPAIGTVTLAQLLSSWVAHDLGHLAQIARVMAKRYAEDVGPWSRFLTIVHQPRPQQPP